MDPGTLCSIWLCLLLSLLLLELHIPIMHHGACQLVDADPFIPGESKDVNGRLKAGGGEHGARTLLFHRRQEGAPHICGHQLLAVINAGHRDLPLANEREVVGVGGDEQSL